jgi:hypothetical protein
MIFYEGKFIIQLDKDVAFISRQTFLKGIND